MSDTRRVENDTKDVEGSVMRALADTAGMSTPERAVFWLEKLAAAKYRGRHDTWTAARDRAAKEAGVELTIAKRIWQRWDSMGDVSGTPLLRLMLAYEALCRGVEESADAMRDERLELQRKRNAVDPSHLAVAGRMEGAPSRAPSPGDAR